MLAPETGDKPQMVVAPTFGVAARRPPADSAVVDGIWIRVRCVVRCCCHDKCNESRFCLPVERAEVVDAIFFRAGGCDDVEELGCVLLDLAEEFCIEAELEDRPSARFAREFRVVRLVGPRAEG